MKLEQSIVVLLTIIILVGILYFFFRKLEMFESQPTITYYYLPSCGWCKKFTPTWEQFEEKVKAQGINVTTRKVNGSDATEEVGKYDIQGFPHIQMVKGDKVTVFEDERSVDALMKFVQSKP